MDNAGVAGPFDGASAAKNPGRFTMAALIASILEFILNGLLGSLLSALLAGLTGGGTTA